MHYAFIMLKQTVHWISILLLLNFIFLLNCDLTRVNLSTVDMPPLGFGAYVIKMRKIAKCDTVTKPIDSNNFSNFSFDISKYNDTEEVISSTIYVNNKVKFYKGVFTPLFLKRDGTYFTSLNRTALNPCTHRILSILLKHFLPMDSNCSVNKGNYSVNNFSINQWAYSFGGTHFIYSRSQLQIEFFSKVGSIFCIYVVADVIPK